MLKASGKALVWKQLHDALNPLVDEVRLVSLPSGLRAKAVDPAQVAMVEFQIGKAAFTDYQATEAEYGVDLDKLKDILKLVRDDDELRVHFDADKHQLVWRMHNLVRRMRLVDTATMGDPKVPNLDLPNLVQVPAIELQRGLKAGEAVSDHVRISTRGQTFHVTATGDTDETNLALGKDDVAKLQASEDHASAFSLDYLSGMVNVAKPDVDIELQFGTDYPMKVKFPLADGHGEARFLLAPRIEA